MVTIYQFEVYQVQTDETVKSRRWGTREAILELAHGQVVEDTAMEVDQSIVESDIRGFTLRDFNPHPRHGFQTRVSD
jgi:hypothetical protein